MSVRMVKCAFCREFVDAGGAFRTGIQSFCSTDHAYEYQKSGNDTPAPEKSEPKRRKPSRRLNVPTTVREQVLKVDAKCRFCGQRSRGNLQVHHVVYRGQKRGIMDGDHQKHNLLTLCRGCHEVVHSDKGRWQPLCLAVIWLRELRGDSGTLVPEMENYDGR
jgi:hypothetical protein